MYQEADLEELGALPRRGFLGVQVGGSDGVRVERVLEGGAATAAGVEVGDRIMTIDGVSIRDARHLAEHGRSIRAGARVVFGTDRGELAAEAPPYPVEEGTLLGHVISRGARLRTLFTIPESEEPKPAVLLVQSVRADSCESPFDDASPVRAFVRAFAAAGFVVMRVERTGVGDSEGPSPEKTGLDVEVDGYRAALRELLAFDEVDPNRVFLFGHSFGGMVAPILAETPVAGVCVLGTSARSWRECMVGTTKRQRGPNAQRRWSELDVARWTKLYDLVFHEGVTPGRAFEVDPELRALRSRDCDGDTMHGRHVSLFQRLHATDLMAAWWRVQSRVLAIHGAGDWICTADESREIAAITNGRFVELEGSSHDIDEQILSQAIAWCSATG